MFTITDDLSIYVTRGDIVHLNVSAVNESGAYKFKVGDVVRFKIFAKKDCSDIIFQKDFPVTTESETAEIFLTGHETRIGGLINKHSDYWYEIELNPESNPQTIIGYDEDGAKIFRLFPEGRTLDKEEPEITPEDVAILDDELDITSLKPVENRAIVRGIERTAQRVTNELNATITAEVETLNNKIAENVNSLDNRIAENTTAIASNKSKIDILDNKLTEDITSLQNYISSEHSDIRGTLTSATSTITNDINEFKDLVNNGYHTEYLGRIEVVQENVDANKEQVDSKIKSIEKDYDYLWDEWLKTTTAVAQMGYPVGTVYTSSRADFDPNKNFGGTWFLLDKEFEKQRIYCVKGNADIENYVGEYNADIDTLRIEHSNHSITISAQATLRNSIDEIDSDRELLRFYPSSMGVTGNGTLVFANYITGIGGKDDFIANLAVSHKTEGDADYIAVQLWNVISRSNKYVSITDGKFTLEAGAQINFTFTLNLMPENMNDTSCNKFYWHRQF